MTVAPSPRNLTDAQIDAVGASGGLVGIVYSVDFLSPECSSDPDVPLSLIARHASHVAERIGVEHVGLGSDFDDALAEATGGGGGGGGGGVVVVIAVARAHALPSPACLPTKHPVP